MVSVKKFYLSASMVVTPKFCHKSKCKPKGGRSTKISINIAENVQKGSNWFVSETLDSPESGQ